MTHEYTVQTRDGLDLVVHVDGEDNADTLVIVPVYGASVDFLRLLATHLSGRFRVLTWASRGVPGPRTSDCRPEAHVDDVASVVSALAQGPGWLLGYCNGADIGLRALIQHPRLFCGAVLACGSFGLGADAPQTKQAIRMRRLLRMSARSVQHAGAIRTYLDKTNQLFQSFPLTADAATIRRKASAYLADAESLHAYATMVLDLVGRDIRQLDPEATAPIKILASPADTVAHWKQSQIVSQRFPSSRFMMVEGWDHYAIVYRDDTWRRIEQDLLELVRGTNATASDRCALPAPEPGPPDLATTFMAPRTPLEAVVAGIWAEVLELEQVGVHDNFFDLGGHSLKATQVMARMGNALQVELPLRRLFERPTIAELCDAIEKARRDAPDPRTPALVAIARAYRKSGPLDAAHAPERGGKP